MDIFSSDTGRIAVYIDPSQDLQISVVPQYWNEVVGPLHAVLTQFTLSHRCQVQFRTMLRQRIYAYTFTDSMGESIFSGFVFGSRACFGFSDGLSILESYYQANKISSTGRPLLLSVGPRIVVPGFLTGLVIDNANPELNLYQFSLRFETLP